MHEEAGSCSYCGERFREDDAQTLADEIAYHEERCDENPTSVEVTA